MITIVTICHKLLVVVPPTPTSNSPPKKFIATLQVHTIWLTFHLTVTWTKIKSMFKLASAKENAKSMKSKGNMMASEKNVGFTLALLTSSFTAC